MDLLEDKILIILYSIQLNTIKNQENLRKFLRFCLDLTKDFSRFKIKGSFNGPPKGKILEIDNIYLIPLKIIKFYVNLKIKML